MTWYKLTLMRYNYEIKYRPTEGLRTILNVMLSKLLVLTRHNTEEPAVCDKLFKVTMEESC